MKRWLLLGQGKRSLRPLFHLANRFAGLRGGKGNQNAAAQLEQSGLFDANWYRRKYPDIAKSGVDPAAHYLKFGWREGRDPGPSFSTKAYLAANADVARAGSNPLLHFIEFGYSEGRGTTQHRAVVKRSSSPGETFGDPVPCASFPLRQDQPIRWRRAFQFDPAERGLLTVAGIPVGLFRNPPLRSDIEAAFDDLKWLSGYGETASRREQELPPECDGSLVDAWYVGSRQLRTRWRSEGGALVVRAYQHDPISDGKLRMVAEGLAATPLDFVDVSLCNPYFPLLFVLAEPDGSVRASRPLAFPSLCRGGIHYAELLALSRSADPRFPIDIGGQSEALASRLQAIQKGDAEPLVSTLAIDLAGGDGSHPLFQADFRSWLSRVIRIGLSVRTPLLTNPGSAFLASTVELPADGARAADGGTLILAADMVPTISILSATGEPGENSPPDTMLSLLVPGSEPAQPATLFELPPLGALKSPSAGTDYPITWPRLIASGNDQRQSRPVPAAIRVGTERALSDAELLFPVSGPDLTAAAPAQPITWLIFPALWRKDTLTFALEALSLQLGVERCAIAFIGDTEADVLTLAGQLFEEGVGRWPDVKSAFQTIGTSLIGYLGTAVILHDERCSQLLASLMRDPVVATASCVLVRSECRGKSWHVSVADAGRSVSSSRHDAVIGSPEAQRMWRSNYPVASPARHLWLARAASLAKWIDDSDSFSLDGLHVCTSLVTASQEASDPIGEPALTPPAASASNAMRVETMFG
jgi:hypothetical protein